MMKKLFRKFFLVTAIVVAGTSLAQSESNDFIYGACIHLSWNESRSDKILDAVTDIGLESYRDDLFWSRVETKKGQFKIPKVHDDALAYSDSSGLRPLYIFDYMNDVYGDQKQPNTPESLAAYVNYVKNAALLTNQRAGFYELWNEWDHQIPPNVAGPWSLSNYLELVRRTAPEFRKANPNGLLLMGATTSAAVSNGWLEALARSGELNIVDGISMHPDYYCEGKSKSNPEAWYSALSEITDRLTRIEGKNAKPFYITEMAWPTNDGNCGVSEELQAQYVARTLLLAQFLPNVHGLWWYDLVDDGKEKGNIEHNLGLLDINLRKKPAYFAAASLVPYLRGSTPGNLKKGDGYWAVTYRLSNGSNLTAVWDVGGAQNRNISIRLVTGKEVHMIKLLESNGIRLIQPSATAYQLDPLPKVFIGKGMTFQLDTQGGKVDSL